MLQVACSDDETDEEDAAPRSKRNVKVRRLVWRSSALDKACVLVDIHKEQIDASIPGTSPGQRGRCVRNRIRSEDAPLSRIEAPPGLPVDCYSEEWLSSLSPLTRNQLEIHPKPVLDELICALKTQT